jgi:hypothetical protein
VPSPGPSTFLLKALVATDFFLPAHAAVVISTVTGSFFAFPQCRIRVFMLRFLVAWLVRAG